MQIYLACPIKVYVWETRDYDPSSHLISYCSKLFGNGFIISIASFKSYPMQYDVHFVKDGPIYSRIHCKARKML